MTQRPPEWSDGPTPMVVVTRYRVPEPEGAGFRDRATAAVDALAAQAGLLAGQLARATDDPTHWVLTLTWESVGHYRRALSAFEVKVTAVPLLSEAVDEPSAFEVLEGRGAWQVTAVSARADNAGQVRLGGEGP